MGKFPYPGDGYNEKQWLIYDISACCLYGLLWLYSSVLLSQTLSRIWVDTPHRVTKMQRMFWRTRLIIVHLISMQTLVRSVYFIVVSGTRDLDEATHRMLLMTLFALMVLPDWLYYTIFSFVVLYWAELFYTMQAQPKRSYWFKRVLVFLNVAVYSSGMIALILAGTATGTRLHWAKLISYSSGIAAIILALFFIHFGYRLTRRFNELPASQQTVRRKVINQVVGISFIGVVCFVYRSSYVLGFPTNDYGELWRLVTYLIVGEIMPIFLILLLFHYLPRRLEGKESSLPAPRNPVNTPPATPHTPRPSLIPNKYMEVERDEDADFEPLIDAPQASNGHSNAYGTVRAV